MLGSGAGGVFEVRVECGGGVADGVGVMCLVWVKRRREGGGV